MGFSVFSRKYFPRKYVSRKSAGIGRNRPESAGIKKYTSFRDQKSGDPGLGTKYIFRVFGREPAEKYTSFRDQKSRDPGLGTKYIFRVFGREPAPLPFSYGTEQKPGPFFFDTLRALEISPSFPKQNRRAAATLLRDSGDVPGERVSRPQAARNPEKHVKTPHFQPHPWDLRPPGCGTPPSRPQPLKMKLCWLSLAQDPSKNERHFHHRARKNPGR